MKKKTNWQDRGLTSPKVGSLRYDTDKLLIGLIKKIPAGTNNQHQNFKKECHCRKYKHYKKS